VSFIGLFRIVLTGELAGLLPQMALAYALGIVFLLSGWGLFTRRSRSYPYMV